MIGAADALFVREAVFKRHHPVRATLGHESVFAARGFEERQVLAEDADLLHGFLLEIRDGSDRLPVAAQQLAHRFVGTNESQAVVLFLADHVPLLLSWRTGRWRSSFIRHAC